MHISNDAIKGLTIIVGVADKYISRLTAPVIRIFERQSCIEMFELFHVKDQKYSVSHTDGNVAIAMYNGCKYSGIGVDLEILDSKAISPLSFKDVIKLSLREAIFKSINNVGGTCETIDNVNLSISNMQEGVTTITHSYDERGLYFRSEIGYNIIYINRSIYVLSRSITTSLFIPVLVKTTYLPTKVQRSCTRWAEEFRSGGETKPLRRSC